MDFLRDVLDGYVGGAIHPFEVEGCPAAVKRPGMPYRHARPQM
jgi:hypothetical protein